MCVAKPKVVYEQTSVTAIVIMNHFLPTISPSLVKNIGPISAPKEWMLAIRPSSYDVIALPNGFSVEFASFSFRRTGDVHTIDAPVLSW